MYPAGGRCPDHTHRPIERRINGTPEMLLVRRGQVEARIFDADRRLVAEPLLDEGDVILLVAGGHGFRMLEDTVLLEIKQGPYGGLDEKERFLEAGRLAVIPVSEPDIGPREQQYVDDCLRSGWVSSAGRYLEEFERRWAAFCGMPHGRRGLQRQHRPGGRRRLPGPAARATR